LKPASEHRKRSDIGRLRTKIPAADWHCATTSIDPGPPLTDISAQEFANRELEHLMPKTAGISSSALRDSEAVQFVSIAQFSGAGLLFSLVIVLLRMNGVF